MGQMASNIMNPNIANPQQAQWGDLDPNEKAARGIAGGLKGLGPGLQNYFQQKTAMANSGGSGPMIQPQQSQMVSPDFFQPQRRGPNNLSFYGDSNG